MVKWIATNLHSANKIKQITPLLALYSAGICIAIALRQYRIIVGEV